MDPFTFVATLAGFAGVVASVVSTTYAYGSSVIHANEAVKDFLTELQGLRTLLQQLETMIIKTDSTTPHFPEVSAKLIPTIIEGQSSLETLRNKLEKRQHTGKLKGAIKRLGWPLAEEDTLTAIQMLARYRGQFQFALSMDTWNITSLTLSTVKEYGEKQGEFQKNARNEQNLEWISSFNYQLKYDTVESMRTANTRKWLIESTLFQSFSLGSSCALWCRGIPGAGKTVSSSIVIDHLSSMSEHDSIAVIYHFFDYLTTEEQSPDLLCRSLLKQLAQQHNSPLLEMEKLRKSMSKRNRKPNQAELMPLIQGLLDKFTRVFIVIDALDECFEGYRSSVLDIISNLHSSGARIFTTSRPHIEPPTLQNHEWEYIEIRAQDEDIRRVFESTLLQKDGLRKRLSPEFKDEIVTAISKRSDGMFLWASLQISQILNNRTPNLIRRALQNMPSKIFDVFENTLERIGDDDLARRTFFWLARADEPLKFSALSHALAIDPQYTTPDGVDVDDIPSIEDLVEICCGLVAVDADMNLRFVHFTVQEYFSQHPECLLPLDDLIIAKTCLSYLSFKEFESGYCDSEEKMQRRLEQYPLYSFAARRWNRYIPEAQELHVEGIIMSIYLHDGLFQSYAQARYSEWADEDVYELGGYFEFQEGYSPLHDAADVGIPSVLEKLLGRGTEPSPRTKEAGITPLHLAVANKRQDLVTILLAAGAGQSISGCLLRRPVGSYGPFEVIKRHPHPGGNRQHEDGWERRFQQHTPVTLAVVIDARAIYNQLKNETDIESMAKILETAATCRLADIVQQVLLNCPAIDHRHPSFANALLTSLQKPDEALVQVLLSARPQVDDRDGLLSRLFLPRAMKCSRTLTDIFVQKGVSVSLQAVFQMSPDKSMIMHLIDRGANLSDPGILCAAARMGMTNVVELLLDRGMDINGHGEYGLTALANAVKVDDARMVELLLDRGSDIELQSVQGTTPLTMAIDTGKLNAARILLSRGAIIHGMLGAVVYGSAEGVELLLDHGVDINTIYNDSTTALTLAIYHGHLEICELLLSRGADPNIPASREAPLIVAFGRDYMLLKIHPTPDARIIELLLKHGADPNAGFSALEIATYHGDDTIVRLLLEHGAALDFRGGLYGSILHAAAQSLNDEMVPIMLNRGAKVFEGDRKYGGLLPLSSPVNYKILIEHGADINARGRKYSHVLQAAIVKWWTLSRSGQNLGYDILEIIKFLLQEGANINHTGGVYHTALQIAARTGNLALVTLLEKEGANIHLKGGRYGTALQAAAYRGMETVVRFLLDAGADINQTGGIYHTALQAAAFRGHEAVTKLLLARKAEVNILGGRYHNALRASQRKIIGRVNAVGEILIQHGAVDSCSSAVEIGGRGDRIKWYDWANFPGLSGAE